MFCIFLIIMMMTTMITMYKYTILLIDDMELF